MNEDYDVELFLNLQKLSSEKPDLVEIFVDSNGEIEFEIQFDFFFDNLEMIFGF
jgi:hypothetical protein